MPDISVEVRLPSGGKLYGKTIQWENKLRAPRLRDKGLGDTTRKNKLQATILDNTLVQPLGMSTYDLHTADFLYLNLKQRQLSKGNTPYKVGLTCPDCKKKIDVSVPLDELEVRYLTEVTPLEYKTLDDHELELTYITPRMLDECTDKARAFQDEYTDTELSFEDLRTQELLRFVIKKVDGKRLTDPQMTDFIQNMFTTDIDGVFDLLNDFDFGIQFIREEECPKCHKKIKYIVPVS